MNPTTTVLNGNIRYCLDGKTYSEDQWRQVEILGKLTEIERHLAVLAAAALTKSESK